VTYNGLITTRYFLDFGPELDSKGLIANYPPSLVDRPVYPIFVSKVDKDGNEIAGVRLPEVEAPVATTTGWALRRAGFSENEGCEANGQHIPLPRTKAERLAAGDPRRSIEERYKDHDRYVKAFRKAAEKLHASSSRRVCSSISTRPRPATCSADDEPATRPGRAFQARAPVIPGGVS
jgi:Alpha/beta hydrolase domain